MSSSLYGGPRSSSASPVAYGDVTHQTMTSNSLNSHATSTSPPSFSSFASLQFPAQKPSPVPPGGTGLPPSSSSPFSLPASHTSSGFFSNAQAASGAGAGTNASFFLPSTSQGGGGRLSLDEIKREFAKYKLECPDSMWKDPQTEQVQGLYSFAIEMIFGLTVNDVRIEEVTGDVRSCLPSIDSLQFLSQDGKLHAKAIGNLRFFRLCQRLNRVLGLPEFSRETFASPTPGGVLRMASAFCSFLRVREGLMKSFESQLQQREVLQQNLQQLSGNLQMVEQELVRFRAERQSQEATVKQQKEQREELEGEIRDRHTELGRLVDEFKEKKTLYGRLELEVEDLRLELMNLRQEKSDLHDQIVHSPEKLMERRDELRQQQKRLEEQLQNLERVAGRHQQLLQSLCKALKKAKKALNLVNEHRNQILGPHAAFRSEMRTREKLHKEVSENRQRLNQRVQQLQNQRRELAKQLEELQDRCDAEEREMRRQLTETRKEAEELKLALAAQQEDTTSLLSQAKDIEKLLHEQRERQDALVRAIDEQTEKLYAGFQTYISQVEFLRGQMPLSLDLSQSASFLVDRHPEKSHGLGSQDTSPEKSLERHSQTRQSSFLDENESLNSNRPAHTLGQASGSPCSPRREDVSGVSFSPAKDRAKNEGGGLSIVDLQEEEEGSAEPVEGETQVTETDGERGSSGGG
ncbi:nuf2 [Cystoisospora suis]|uniref:Nuf2 n=1 Tax=Cystoisospora suis TaxID=483139 RepID=A0A2C6LF67_9APIC|nr:nuf2 [Cystoisospora suis]